MKKIKKRKQISFFSYIFIGVLVAGITVGVIVVQEGSHMFSFAKSPFGISVATSGACGWCGSSCLPREQLLRVRCADIDKNPGFSCLPTQQNGQMVCSIVQKGSE